MYGGGIDDTDIGFGVESTVHVDIDIFGGEGDEGFPIGTTLGIGEDDFIGGFYKPDGDI